MQRLARRLRQKKWEIGEIKEAISVLHSASTKRHRIVSYISTIVAIVMILAGNFIASLIFIPLMLALNGWFLYFIVALTGIGLGLLFEILTRSIAALQSRHHVLLGMLIPLAALLSTLFIVVFSNGIALEFGIGNEHNPYYIAMTYALAFLAPYAHYKFVLRKHYYSG